jgi:hypothetical protein
MKFYGIGIFDDNKKGQYRIVNLSGVPLPEFALAETRKEAINQCIKYFIENPRFADDGIEDVAWRLDDVAVQKLVDGKWEFLRSEITCDHCNETME